MCRSRFTRLRVALRLPFWLCILWVMAWGVFGCVMTFGFGGNSEWGALLMAVLLLSLISFVIILPFLILSFTSSFYGERLKSLLRLPPADAAPPVAIPAPIADRDAARL
jgi:hypothetical protein